LVFTERDWEQECCHGNNIVGVILLRLSFSWLRRFQIALAFKLLKPPSYAGYRIRGSFEQFFAAFSSYLWSEACAEAMPGKCGAEVLPTGFGKSLIFHAPTPTRFARGFTLCSPNFFPPSLGTCSQVRSRWDVMNFLLGMRITYPGIR